MAVLISFSCFVSVSGQVPSSILFKRIQEPEEQAFSILIPHGWTVSGGIVRINAASSGAANAIEAKLDFEMYRDAGKTVQIHWLPDYYYFDASGSPAAAMFPEGSNYNGMLVLGKRSAEQFVTANLIPLIHPGARDLVMLEKNEARELEKLLAQYDRIPEMGMIYDAFVCDYRYSEGSTTFRERMLCVVVDMGPYTAGMWKNSNTVYFRTPEKEFARWEPVFSVITRSVILNSEWILGEIRGQAQRGQIMVNTMQEMNRIDQEMQQAHIKTTEEINRQAFLNLTDQEDYIDPYTGEVETGSNQWRHRWKDDLGNVLYTDVSEYDPNLDTELNMSGFKRSRVKK